MKIGIRVDGGENIGMGHIQRCLALASQLKRKKEEVMFLILKNKEMKEIIERRKFEIVELKSGINLEEDLKCTIEMIKSFGIDTLITDSYKFDEEYLKEIKKNVNFLVSIDDLAKTSFPSGIVINQNICAKNLKYHFLSGNTECLFGPKYALLREEFQELKIRKLGKEVKNVLVTLGGSDEYNLTPRTLKCLDEIEGFFKTTVVVGPFFKNIQGIKNVIGGMQKSTRLVSGKINMAELMLASDFAITAGGTTLYELAATGTPALVFCLADNQARSIEGMSRSGVIMNLGRPWQINKENFLKKVKAMIHDYSLREKMSKRGQALVDGKGSIRCATEIITYYNKKQGEE